VNNLPGTAEMLELLDALKNAAKDFAAREDKLVREKKSRLEAAQKRLDQTRVRLFEQSGDRADAVQDELSEKREQAEARCAQLKAKIKQAHANVRRAVLNQIFEEENHDKFSTQNGLLAAGKDRDAALAQAAVSHTEFQQHLAAMREQLVRQEAAAQSAFGGYGKFRKLLAPEKIWPEPDLSADMEKLFARFQQLLTETDAQLKQFGKIFLAVLFRFLPVWLLGIFLVLAAAAVPVLEKFGVKAVTWPETGAVIFVLVILFVLRAVGGKQAVGLAEKIAADLAQSRRLDAVCFEKADLWLQQEQQRIQEEFDATTNALNQHWKQRNRETIAARTDQPAAVDRRAQAALDKCENLRARRLQEIEREARQAGALVQESVESQQSQLATGYSTETAKIEREFAAQWQALLTDWNQTVPPLAEKIRAAEKLAGEIFPAWDAPAWENWKPLENFCSAVKLGSVAVDLAQFAGALPKDSRLQLPGGSKFSAPLLLDFPAHGSVLFETGKDGETEALAAMNNLIFRLLSAAPPGKLSFTIIDPVGLGQNFAALMHLADYEEGSINSRIWTQPAQIEERLAELNEHMEKVIQMYLRNDYATITEYNAQAGNLAEKYHFLVVASFPANFTDTAARRLRNIAASGARCGVFTLIQRDARVPLPPEFVADELQNNSVCLVRGAKNFELANWRQSGAKVVLDAPPSAETATQFLHRVGESSKDSTRVEVPFAQIAPAENEIWSGVTAEELRVPIGRSGATKLQWLELGKGTRQHTLIAGKTGSGKSTLFHVIITNLALSCSPDQVEFYLVDFKKGVEFKCYGSRKLPHAKVVAIESDREFGLSVLQRVDDELRRRGDLFRQLGVQDVAGYRAAGGGEPMPRALLMIDEFQEFFTEEDRISQGAAVLLDRIVRQGRAFGIHVILGSQTLGGAYTLARATIGQMVVRIALQCNEADAYLIMDQDNPAPRLLSRPGEGIYNDAAGAIEGNSPFQAVWLSEKSRDEYLAKIRARADASGKNYPAPFVFEGNAPADVRENVLLNSVLAGNAEKNVPPRAWLGAPNAIKGPTEAIFQRHSGGNLLVAGQGEERTTTMIAVSLIALAAQFPKGGARFVVLDSTPPGVPQREFLDAVIRAVPHEVLTLQKNSLEEILSLLAGDLKQRGENESAPAPETFLFVHGLQNFKRLRAEDDFSFSSAGDAPNPAAVFSSLVSDGPARGIHVVATCDTYNNISRFIGRKMLGEFELRVLFQMSAGDSASLIDSPDAATLGLHRALFYHDREGYMETFRPYARPANDWLDAACRVIARD
jgi:DNA segregation ATPase FtsK/SpoIIIE, S-DNA-T family